LVENGGRYYFLQPELGVIGSGATVSAAYEKFIATRQIYLSEIASAGLSGLLASSPAKTSAAVFPGVPVATVAKDDFKHALKIFVAKFCIVLAVIGVVVAAAGQIVGSAVGRLTASLDGLQPISISDVDTKIADIVGDFRSLSPERKEALRQNIGAMSRELQPLADAWRTPPAASGSPTTPPDSPGKKSSD
jgi:hypothetical protein